MKKDDAHLGSLVQRCALPEAAGMDALEARLVSVQEVPPRMELRFFAVRGEDREPLSTAVALATSRAHLPRKPIVALTETELLVEVAILRAETDRMRPVYDTAKAWRAHRRAWPADITADAALVDAVDAAIATEDP